MNTTFRRNSSEGCDRNPPLLIAPTTTDIQNHQHWMGQALALAVAAGEAGEVPVAALIVDAQGQLLTQAQNRRERDHDPTAHAEVLALRQAGQLRGHWHLSGCTLYVTLEPCPMCAGAIILARPSRLIYGVDDPKTGAIRTVLNLPDSSASNHKLEVWGGILERECREALQHWFNQKRRSFRHPRDGDAQNLGLN